MHAEELLAAKFAALFPHLDERQRRLVMGAEARALGHGGIRLVARAAGVGAAMVARGVAQLDSGEEPLGRARRGGGGRKRAAEADPGLRPALLALVDPGTRGDPMSPLRWTAKSTPPPGGGAGRGRAPGVGADSGGAAEGGELQPAGQRQDAGGARHADRDAQFRYINGQARDHMDAGDPVNQRGRQEEGECRAVQEERPGMAAQGRPRAGERP